MVGVFLLTAAVVPLMAQGTGRSRSLPVARVGEPYFYTVAVEGLAEPIEFTWQYDELPAGLGFDGPSLSGTPTEERREPYRFGLEVTDALGRVLTAQLSLSIKPPIEELRIVTRRLPSFLVGEHVDFELAVRGGQGTYRWNAATTPLPEGLQIECASEAHQCRLIGTPTEPGEFRWQAEVQDAVGYRDQVDLAGRAVRRWQPLTVTTTELSQPFFQVPYSEHLCALGGLPPYTWRIVESDGPRPDWLQLDPSAGVLSGAPPTLGSSQLSLEVTDRVGAVARADNLKLTVRPVPLGTEMQILPRALPPAIAGRSYSMDLVATPSQGFVRWEVDGASEIPWLAVKDTGPLLHLSGVPGTTGSWQLSIEAWDVDRADDTAQTLAIATPRSYDLEAFGETVRPESRPDAGQPYLLRVLVGAMVVCGVLVLAWLRSYRRQHDRIVKLAASNRTLLRSRAPPSP
jgi:hypothetical protein